MDERARAATRLTRERWEANAEYWVKVIRGRHDRYRTELTDGALLDAIGDALGRLTSGYSGRIADRALIVFSHSMSSVRFAMPRSPCATSL